MRTVLSPQALSAARWKFGEQGKPPWSESLVFLPDGKIGGYQNEHERSWKLVDGRLEIFSIAGTLTWRFISVGPPDAPLQLEGTFLLDGGFRGTGVLHEIAAPQNSAAAASGKTAAGKLAILVIGYSAPKILDRLAAHFSDGKFRFFVHIDAKQELAKYTAYMEHAERFNFIDDRKKIYWGGFRMVEAEIALIKAALQDSEISNVVLISDDTAPLAHPEAIYAALAETPDRIASTANGWREGWYRGFFFPDSNVSSLRGDLMHEARQLLPADFQMISRLEKLRARGKKPIKEVRFCRQWWALGRVKLEKLIQFIDADEHFVESFRFSLFPDETFFPTAFKLCFPDEKTLEVPTYADFATVPRHPNPWIFKSATEIGQAKTGSDHLFIRKITPDRPAIIDDLVKTWTPPLPAAVPVGELEAVRMVIWDLDETFWRGTLTEGGITYIQDYHDIVVELANRGIISSICSKNDMAPVRKLLTERGVWDYFVFPSINWDAKGPRVAALVEAVQLRPPTILFIDDNALNRNEVLHFLPDMQVADETIIPGLLANALCKGKDDAGLTRLAQYKLLETRHKDMTASGDNVAFLNASNIRVTMEHDLEAHLDRAIELINRTNQLNFTKQRLPEDPAKAREALRYLLNQYDIQAGLVHVQDRYGDYGFVGVYVIRTVQSHSRLVHYCFSCRTLGIGVESWLYDQLGRPNLQVSGEVLTDLFATRAPIDWINKETIGGDDAHEKLAGRILVRGGCAMASTAHYLALNADTVVGEFNIVNDGKHARRDHSVFLRYALEGLPEPALAEAIRLGYVADDFKSELALGPSVFDVCVFSFMNDARFALYRHPEHGLLVPFFELFEDAGANLLALNLSTMQPFIKAPEMIEIVRSMRARKYQFVGISAAIFQANLTAILAYIPDRVTLIFLLDPETYTDKNGELRELRHFKQFNAVIRDTTAGRANLHLLNVLDFVKQPSDRINADHFNRMVYFRIYQRIAEILRGPASASLPLLAGAA